MKIEVGVHLTYKLLMMASVKISVTVSRIRKLMVIVSINRILLYNDQQILLKSQYIWLFHWHSILTGLKMYQIVYINIYFKTDLM